MVPYCTWFVDCPSIISRFSIRFDSMKCSVKNRIDIYKQSNSSFLRDRIVKKEPHVFILDSYNVNIYNELNMCDWQHWHVRVCA